MTIKSTGRIYNYYGASGCVIDLATGGILG